MKPLYLRSRHQNAHSSANTTDQPAALAAHKNASKSGFFSKAKTAALYSAATDISLSSSLAALALAGSFFSGPSWLRLSLLGASLILSILALTALVKQLKTQEGAAK